MATGKTLLRRVAGKLVEIVGVVVSMGGANAYDIPALDGTGKFDVSLLPVGVGPDVSILPASEAIGDSKWVNIWVDTADSILKVRLADNSNSREANGWAKVGGALGANIVIYHDAPNDGVTGCTPATRQYLGTLGGQTETPPEYAAGARISQFLGKSVNASYIDTEIEDFITLVNVA